jgi:hypothetical protein
MQSTRILASNYHLPQRSGTVAERYLAFAFLAILYAQNPPWPVWDFQSHLVAVSVPVALMLTAKNGLGYFRGGYIGFLSVMYGFCYFFLFHGVAGAFRLSTAFFILTVYAIFRSDIGAGARAFDLVSRSFAGILLVSLVFWLLWQFGVPLPSSPLAYGAWKGDDVAMQLDNFYIFVSESQTLLNRFYSVFDEPGVVGTLAAMILCGLRFDFSRKRTWIILAGGLCSWSLAFVVLSIIGVFFFQKGAKLKLALGGGLVLVIVGIVILFGAVLPSSDSAGLLLLYRIANFSSYGVSSRTDDQLNAYFFEYLSSARALFGEGTSFFQQRPELLSGQGGIFYVLEYGLAGMVFLLLTYVAIIRSHFAGRFQGYLLLVVFLLSFLQRPHMMTPWQIVLFWTILCSWAVAKGDPERRPQKELN